MSFDSETFPRLNNGLLELLYSIRMLRMTTDHIFEKMPACSHLFLTIGMPSNQAQNASADEDGLHHSSDSSPSNSTTALAVCRGLSPASKSENQGTGRARSSRTMTSALLAPIRAKLNEFLISTYFHLLGLSTTLWDNSSVSIIVAIQAAANIWNIKPL